MLLAQIPAIHGPTTIPLDVSSSHVKLVDSERNRRRLNQQTNVTFDIQQQQVSISPINNESLLRDFQLRTGVMRLWNRYLNIHLLNKYKSEFDNLFISAKRTASSIIYEKLKKLFQ